MHYGINPASRLGGKLLNDLRQYRLSRNELKLTLAIMNEMGSDNDYQAVSTEFGFATGEGQEGKQEFESMIGKVLTDSQVSGVDAAHEACFARLL